MGECAIYCRLKKRRIMAAALEKRLKALRIIAMLVAHRAPACRVLYRCAVGIVHVLAAPQIAVLLHSRKHDSHLPGIIIRLAHACRARGVKTIPGIWVAVIRALSPWDPL